jgi:hypothetical protein
MTLFPRIGVLASLDYDLFLAAKPLAGRFERQPEIHSVDPESGSTLRLL